LQIDATNSSLFATPEGPNAVRIVPMGGCGEFGMNLTAYIHQDRLFVVDCGLRFPDPMKLGVDAVIPRVDEWFEKLGGVYAYIITHGHEDHIGAIPSVIRKWPAPIYATAWTAELLKNKFIRRGIDLKQHPITIVSAGDKITADGIEIEYVHINHSIPMSCALFIRTDYMNIFHTGDFKFESQPIIEAPTDFEYLKRLGDEGVDVLLADSTNAEQKGFCPGENSVIAPLLEVCKEAAGAIFLTTFSSNLWRLRTAIEVFRQLGRKVFIAGAGLENTLTVAKATELYFAPEGILISEEKIDEIPRDRLAVIATGCQGEYRSAMVRICHNEHKRLSIQEGDTVIFSSRIIPGNEKSVITMSNHLKKLGAKVVTTKERADIHVSGHAFGGDLQKLVTLLRPMHFMPVHGGFSQLNANLEGARQQATTTGDTLLIETGDVIDAYKEGLILRGKIDVQVDYLDGESGVVLTYETLRERLRIGEQGGVILSGVFSKREKRWLKRAKIEFYGVRLPININPDKWYQGAVDLIEKRVQKLVESGTNDEEVVGEEARITLRRHLTLQLKKKPVVLTQIYIV
jgi:ribonuclease J